MRVAAAPPAPFDALPGSPLILRDGTVATIWAAGPGDRVAVRTFFHERLMPREPSPAPRAAHPILFGSDLFVPNHLKRRRHPSW